MRRTHLMLGSGLALTIVAIALCVSMEGRASGRPILLTEAECLSLLGGQSQNCDNATANCGNPTAGCTCYTYSCTSAGCTPTTACTSSPSGGCWKIVMSCQGNCGVLAKGVNTTCQNTLDPVNGCAVVWTAPLPPPYNCNYVGQSGCGMASAANCGALKQTCASQ